LTETVPVELPWKNADVTVPAVVVKVNADPLAATMSAVEAGIDSSL
jgi:hypothetical protein